MRHSNSVRGNRSIAETFPIVTVRLDAAADVSSENWVCSTDQHFHLLYNEAGPEGYARTGQQGHRLHAFSFGKSIPKAIDASLTRLGQAGVDQDARVRIVSCRELGIVTVWAEDQSHSLICVCSAAGSQRQQHGMPVMTEREFRTWVAGRLKTAAEKPRPRPATMLGDRSASAASWP